MATTQLSVDELLPLLDPDISPDDVSRLVAQARSGDSAAQFELAEQLRTRPRDREVPRPWRMITPLLVAAAHSGSDSARLVLGQLHVAKEPDSAIEWVRPLAELGHPEAMHLMGVAMRNRGDLQSAIGWYRAAAEADAPQGWSFLGDVLHSDLGDREAAITAYRNGVAARDNLADLRLRFMADEFTREGETAQAYELYRWLVDHGDPEAAIALAALYVPRTSHPEEVLFWLRRAHELGDSAEPAGQAAELHELLGDLDGATWWREQQRRRDTDTKPSVELPKPPPGFGGPPAPLQHPRRGSRASQQ